MAEILLILRLILAATFCVAAITKLADRAGTRRAVEDFGVPIRLTPMIAGVLPILELVIALSLLVTAISWWGALGAFLLLGSFDIAILRSMRRGEQPDCHCFGQLHSEPIGWKTLGRNGLLMVAAGVLLWQIPGRSNLSPFAWVTQLETNTLVLLALSVLTLSAISVGSWIILELMAQNGRLLSRIEAIETTRQGIGQAVSGTPVPAQGLAIGTTAPAFELPDLNGARRALPSLLDTGKSLLLLFADPNCGPCDHLLGELAKHRPSLVPDIEIAIISRGDLDANRRKAALHGFEPVLLQDDFEIATAYLIRGTPSAVMIAPDGKVDSHLVTGAEAIHQLLDERAGTNQRRQIPLHRPTTVPNGSHNGHALNSPLLPMARRRGQPIPDLQLATAEGEEVSLLKRIGRDSVLLFWNSSCGFCQRMLPDLQAWQADADEASPDLVIVSPSTADQAFDHPATILIDREFALGKQLGAGGTPSAIAVDGRGRITSEVVVGAEAIMGLLRRESVGVSRRP